MDRLDPKTDGATANIVEQNIEMLRELFPEAFTEGSDEQGPRWMVDIDALREILGQYVEDQPERYSFTWNGKNRARRIAQTPSTGTLRPCPEESINWDTTQNLFIEGDNLEVLKLLQKSYHKRVKMIYIDPPYNTGKEFIYPDKFQDNLDTYLRYTGQTDEEGLKLSANAETSGRYHTNWLNMMLPRLKLARNLLAEDGVLFISIDDHEVSNLKHMCDEILGQENWVSQIVAQVNPRGRHLDQFVAKTHEYVLVYARNIDVSTTVSMLPKRGRMLDEYRKEDDGGRYRELELRNRNPAFNSTTRPNLYYPLYAKPSGGSVTLENDEEHTIEVWPKNSEGADSCWTWGKKKVSEDRDLLLARQVGDGGWRVFRKDYLIRDGQMSGTLPKSLWVDKEFNHDYGKKAIQDLLGSNVMDFPKSPHFIQRMVQLGTLKNGIVLDFFSGSCSTAEAVLRLNAGDGGTRSFIMAQLPELTDGDSKAFKEGFKTIADIGKERIRQVIGKIESEQVEQVRDSQEKLPGTVGDVPELDLGFKVFKLDASNIKPWDADFDNLEAALFNAVENIKPDRSEADVLYELLLKYGLDLAVPIEERKIDGKTVHIIGVGALVVCLADKISLNVVEGIAAMKDELKPEVMRVVFKDAGFADDVVKTNAVQILRQAEIEDVRSL